MTLLDSRFSIDDRVFTIAGIEMDDAITIARNLVEYTTIDQFKKRAYESPPASEVAHVYMKPLGPIERTFTRRRVLALAKFEERHSGQLCVSFC